MGRTRWRTTKDEDTEEDKGKRGGEFEEIRG